MEDVTVNRDVQRMLERQRLTFLKGHFWGKILKIADIHSYRRVKGQGLKPP